MRRPQCQVRQYGNKNPCKLRDQEKHRKCLIQNVNKVKQVVSGN